MAYGTNLIDLQTKIPLLKTGKQNDVTEWPKNHPEIELITRDGSKTYAKALTEASSTILQVGDRWHILHQLFEEIKKSICSFVPAKWTPIHLGKIIVKEKTNERPFRKEEYQRLHNEDKRWVRIQHVQLLYDQGYTVSATPLTTN